MKIHFHCRNEDKNHGEAVTSCKVSAMSNLFEHCRTAAENHCEAITLDEVRAEAKLVLTLPSEEEETAKP